MTNMYQSSSVLPPNYMNFPQSPTASPRFFTLENASVRAVFTDTGASLCGLFVSKNQKGFQNIALGFSSPDDYLDNDLCAGSVLGPAAGRIREGKLSIGGRLFQLTKNDGKHHLHGGVHGLPRLIWQVSSYQNTEKGGVLLFSAFLPDQTDGYPGNRLFHAEYTLEGTCLRLRLKAVSDQDTFFNLSGHSYFNLNAASASPSCQSCGGLLQRLRISASQVVFNTDEHIPDSLRPVGGTAFDFRQGAVLADQLGRFPSEPQLQWAKGYNHTFLLNSQEAPAAILESLDRSVRLKLFTDAPCLVLYSGGFIDESRSLWKSLEEASDSSGCSLRTFPGCAVALEAQDIPDAPNQRFLPFRITKAGETFSRLIEYHIEL